MKSNEQPSLYFSKNTNPDSANTKKEEAKSPYLKAILSGRSENNGGIIQLAISDRHAAIRYIKESKWRENFLRS